MSITCVCFFVCVCVFIVECTFKRCKQKVGPVIIISWSQLLLNIHNRMFLSGVNGSIGSMFEQGGITFVLTEEVLSYGRGQ